MTSYDSFAKFYDAVMGEPTARVTLLQTLIQELHPETESVLELGCGTGAVLKHLHPPYRIAGLDLSEGMLEVARRNVPDATFYQGDMSTFSLPMSFDVILCVFDSINHLTSFAQWQSLFQHVDHHLNAQGLFIFDINTLDKLERLSKAPPSVQEFAANYLLMNITETENRFYNWRLQIFEQVDNDLYRRHETNILEASFPVPQIEQAASEFFEIKRLFDPRNIEVVPASQVVYFVCQKRG
jgi:SAM-dependent methyltransferase